MKRDWLVYLVIFSLALNLGTIGVVAYLHYQNKQEEVQPLKPPPPGLKGLFKELNLDRDQKQTLRRMFPEHRQAVMKLRQEIAQKRLELFDLLKPAEPSSEAIAAKIKEITAIQGNLENEEARFLLEMKKALRSEQQEQLLEVIGQRLIPRLTGLGLKCPNRKPCPSMGRGQGRGHRRGPKRGMPPGPPPGPKLPLDTPHKSGGPG
ncbi:MAG: periplasmic heavy metal sensor [Deltaproteobacteria bacterium]|nr:periplasmic heavy metal sensor [Deltaproteobacteria bacterium]MBW1952011.1 periplasmic heavy metal sensor [Deltaproteobacteria bacterium]MBW1986075.1 periplasmic heavy metal sensor [Deltaproteobacteria bacterium]MBW2134239.1 periplasmic heavy metal sensor [Deltaproteobacteria bacterium]